MNVIPAMCKKQTVDPIRLFVMDVCIHVLLWKGGWLYKNHANFIAD